MRTPQIDALPGMSPLGFAVRSPSLFAQIAAIAAPIVFKVGDSALWACRDMGSHLARVSFSDDMTIAARLEATRANLNLFDATVSVWPGCDWYLLEATGADRGTVRKVSETTARALFVDKVRDLETTARGRKPWRRDHDDEPNHKVQPDSRFDY